MSDEQWSSSYPPDEGDRFAKVKLMLARVFGDGENPLAWGFSIGRISGIRVRIHVLFIVYVLSELIFTLPGHHEGFVFVWTRLVALISLVVLHEIGHVIACWRVGGEVDEVMLWPLGGLGSYRGIEGWKSDLKLALAGPMVHLVLLPIFVGALYALTGGFGSLSVNLLTLGTQSSAAVFSDGTTSWWLILLDSFYSMNLILLVLNLCVPMHPLDAGGILRSALWNRKGESVARWQTINVGLGVATVLGLIGIVFEDGKLLLVIAIFGGIVCSMARRRMQFLRSGDMVPGVSNGSGNEWKEGLGESLVDEKYDELISEEELDRILAKISSKGMGALTRKEKRMLKRTTESSRNSE